MATSGDFNGQLLFEDGMQLFGRRFGANGSHVSELVFNTSPVGYQEIVSDPSYTDQTVVMAYPLIGNYGIAPEDFETQTPTIGGLVVRDYCDTPSNFRSVMTLSALLEQHGTPGICGVDTRMLVRHIRDNGCCKVLLTDTNTPLSSGIEMLKNYDPPRDAVSRVSLKAECSYSIPDAKYRVIAVDCGMKQNIVHSLSALGCSVIAVPWNTPAVAIEALHPDGILISNGPGDPTDVAPVIELVCALRGKYPMFGICLGHQIIALACGAKTYKLKYGHRGGNHPVREIATGKIEITSQNHSYAVDAGSLAGTSLSMTHINLLDGTAEGLESKANLLMSVQYHPESAPGPQDSRYLFGRFLDLMEEQKNAKED